MKFELMSDETISKKADVILSWNGNFNCEGKLCLTSRRIFFESPNECGFSFDLDSILSVTFTNILFVFSEGFTIHFVDNSKAHIRIVHNREDWVRKILAGKADYKFPQPSEINNRSVGFNAKRTAFRMNIMVHFSFEELRNICFDLGVDYENLPGETKDAKIRELIIYCERNSRINQLVAICKELRPTIDW